MRILLHGSRTLPEGRLKPAGRSSASERSCLALKAPFKKSRLAARACNPAMHLLSRCLPTDLQCTNLPLIRNDPEGLSREREPSSEDFRHSRKAGTTPCPSGLLLLSESLPAGSATAACTIWISENKDCQNGLSCFRFQQRDGGCPYRSARLQGSVIRQDFLHPQLPLLC